MKQHRAILAVCSIAQLLVVLDSSILTVALPQLAADLGISRENLPWVVNAFAIPIAGLLLVSGRLADTFGARRILLVGFALFAVASLVGGMAPTAGVLIAARVAQGIAAALISPATLSLLSYSFSAGPDRARAFGLWGAAAGSGGAIGVLAGGLLVEWAGWRWTLLVNIPLCVVLLGLLTIAIGRIQPVQKDDLDLPGAATGTVCVTTLTLGFASLQSEWLDVPAAVWLITAAVSLLLFVFIEIRSSPNPLLPLRRLAGERVWQLPVAMLLVGGAMTSTFYFLTLNFQVHRELNALQTGLSFLPLSVAAFIAAAASPGIVRKLGSIGSAVLAVLLMGLCLVTIAALAQDGWTGAIILISAGFGAGMGVAISTLANLITASCPSSLGGIASGTLTTAQQIGNTIGLAAIVSIDLGTASPGHDIAFLAAALLALITAGWLAYQAMRRRSNRSINTPSPRPAAHNSL
ncbi:MFS transporter [Cryobacterium sp. N21]|uniref:MFS transporter n=1 Tax=Cryobacterium sp. N21 TaxID=2048289 RepID=UPI000CE3E4E3|nr:MFS transporter [Cryobacterium sp. N21]